MPLNATLFNGCLVSLLGCIYVGSTTAFNAFVGSFVLMSSASYTAAILPNLLTRRKNIVYGPFQLGRTLGFGFSAVACGYMLVWFVIYCFPFALPTSTWELRGPPFSSLYLTARAGAQSMNYASLIFGGLTLLVALWWGFGASRNGYEGPKAVSGIAAEIEQVRKASVASGRGKGA